MRRELPLVSRLRRGVASIALGWGIGCALAVAPVVEARDVEGLVVYFPFDEGAGGSVTDPRGGHEGSIIGDAVWGKGKYGGGLDFGGEDGVLRHLRLYAEPELAAALSAIQSIDDYEYDWGLNGSSS